MSKFDVVEWMTVNGHPYYKNKIEQLAEDIRVRREAFGEGADVGEFLKEVEIVRREAEDRYDDWASDPDY